MLRRHSANVALGIAAAGTIVTRPQQQQQRRPLSSYEPKPNYCQDFVPIEAITPPEDSYLVTAMEGIDEVSMSFKGMHYFRDCYFKEVSLPYQVMETVRRGTTAKREFAEYFLLHFANCFVKAPCFKIEAALVNLVKRKRRPRSEKFWAFNVGDELGIWKVVHRTAQEICLEWKVGETKGRTYLAVQTNNETPEELRLLFGSALWPFPKETQNGLNKLGTTMEQEVMHKHNTESMYEKYWKNGPRRQFLSLSDGFHSRYSKILLWQAAAKFMRSWEEQGGAAAASIMEYGSAVTKVSRAELPDTPERRRVDAALEASAIPLTTGTLCRHPNLVLRKVAQQALRTPMKVALVLDDLEEGHIKHGVTYFELLDRSVYWATQLAHKKDPKGGIFRPKREKSSDDTSGSNGVVSTDESGDFNVLLVDSPGATFVYSLLATWILDGMAIPTCHQHTLDTEISHVMSDSGSANMFYNAKTVSKMIGKETDWDKVLSVSSSDVEDDDASPEDMVTKSLEKLMEEHLNEFMERTKAATAESTVASTGEAAPMRVETAVRVSDGTIPSDMKREQLYGNLSPTDGDALLVYTSGTTAKPKGVVHTHASVSNQVSTLISSWGWKPTDRLLNVLPFHHVHGLVNGLFCALGVGATCIISPFNAQGVVRALGMGKISLFFAVPSIYGKLIEYIENEHSLSEVYRQQWKKVTTNDVRLMVSGSAALPVPFIEKWRNLSGHTLLERYGMTEVGMALSQPLRPIKDRQPGTVGYALPSVQTKVEEALEKEEEEEKKKEKKDSSSKNVVAVEEEEEGGEEEGRKFHSRGQLLVSSPSVFDRYWRNPTATAKEFVTILTKQELSGEEKPQRWFRTGDTVGCNQVVPIGARTTDADVSAQQKSAVDKVETQSLFTILGRTSVDIIKSSGYKLSALEIESALLLDPTPVSECAVYGVPCSTLGEKVVAVVTLKKPLFSSSSSEGGENSSMSESDEEVESELAELAAERLARYKQPRAYRLVQSIPRNAMGKVNKKELRDLMEKEQDEMTKRKKQE